ncbi:eukaryotic peptide chain release factor subunit 1 [Naegleria gruberi]|uniref:Eukaryotic peptide chain release factor subunit 1 n=1 Tax=Naegleria gruberi TaxID=5762 RepID=D2V2K9_NAEGR|nr:eukaryotic peptide chain release factor subunit 1 [Naegleria gruberi]EFC48913.1 eukaryotic peptide chain release factor subunit 1 [Naegleria gruberi]|eukprot:XP_002681657.1 eukaryotic peptide chain release factor subunit 1 [Naegleria gruberi strain NEG-M]
MVNPDSAPGLFSDDESSLVVDNGLEGSDNNAHVDLKKLCVMIEPPNPIDSNLYYCDDCFHVEQLRSQLQEFNSGKTYGVIVITGTGTLYGTLRGNTSSILREFSHELPKKHSKGGQSRERFARNREIAKNEYLKIIAEKANGLFVSSALNAPTVDAIILAGCAELKNELLSLKSDCLDYRLRTRILTVVDVAYGGRPGFYQAIQLAQNEIQDSRFLEESETIQELLNLLSKGSKAVVGLEETMFAIASGWASKVILCEKQSSLKRVTLSDDSVHYLEEDKIKFLLERNSVKVARIENLIDYLVDNYKKIGIDKLSLVTDCTNEGNMFLKGFSGIGAILKFDVNVASLLSEEKDNFEAFEEEAYNEDLSEFY